MLHFGFEWRGVVGLYGPHGQLGHIAFFEIHGLLNPADQPLRAIQPGDVVIDRHPLVQRPGPALISPALHYILKAHRMPPAHAQRVVSQQLQISLCGVAVGIDHQRHVALNLIILGLRLQAAGRVKIRHRVALAVHKVVAVALLVRAYALHADDVIATPNHRVKALQPGLGQQQMAQVVARHQQAAQAGGSGYRIHHRLAVAQLKVGDRRAHSGLHQHAYTKGGQQVFADPLDRGIAPLPSLVDGRAAHQVARAVAPRNAQAAVALAVKRVGSDHIARNHWRSAYAHHHRVLPRHRRQRARHQAHRNAEGAADVLNAALHIALQPALVHQAFHFHRNLGAVARVLLWHISRAAQCAAPRPAAPAAGG